jgi:hypothetical protein
MSVKPRIVHSLFKKKLGGISHARRSNKLENFGGFNPSDQVWKWDGI